MRRLPLLLLLVLLPVPAQADRHKMEFSLDGSTGSFTLRPSYGIRLWSSLYPPKSPAAPDPEDPESAKGRESLFLFGETDFVWGTDHVLDGLMGGLRYRTCGECRIEPFGHLMVGAQRPSRPDGDDAATDLKLAGGVGLGFDFELDPEKKYGIIWLVRFQIDLVESSASPGFDRHGRGSVGVTVRHERKH